MTVNLKQHLTYSKDPVLFAKEQWLTLDAFDKFQCKIIKPFDYQLDLINNFDKINFNIVAKSRQMHLSSSAALYIAWYVLFNSDKTVGIIAVNSESAQRILERIRMILQHYSVDNEKDGRVTKTYFHWEDDFVINNKREIKLKNGCKIFASSATPDAGKGYSLDFVYIDEAAFIKYYESIFASIIVSSYVKKNSKVIIGSTPNEDSFFNKQFLEASVKNNFNPIRLHWSLHPVYSKGIEKNENSIIPTEYISPWAEDFIKRLNYNTEYIEQELECIVRYKEQSNKSKTISLRISDDLYKKLKVFLKNQNNISDYIRMLIEKDLDSKI